MEAMLADRNGSQSGLGAPAEAVNGICNSDRRCRLLPAFLIPIGIALILQYSRAVPLVYLNIRYQIQFSKSISHPLISYM